MAILIEGMEMPKEDEEIIIRIDSFGTVMTEYALPIVGVKAVPVQPHGRLIDADAMLMRINHEVMEAYMDGVCYGVHPNQEYLYLLGEIIDDAPTIIPASEEG